MAKPVLVPTSAQPRLRPTFAYELMTEGVPMAIIQAQLGHSSLATTDRYLAHIAPKQVIETMAKRDWEP